MLEVVEAIPVTPAMRRVSLCLSSEEPFASKPGQSLILVLPGDGDEPACRHYTVRKYHEAHRLIDIDVVLHGDSPANRWARNARPGDRVLAVGPRGHVTLKQEIVDHLMLADETGLPAVLSMLEAMPHAARATALVEIAAPSERQPWPVRPGIDIRWLVRSNGASAGEAVSLALREMAPSPSVGRHAYIVGETAAVRSQRHYLLSCGFEKSAISAEGYWRPGRIGGHDHID